MTKQDTGQFRPSVLVVSCSRLPVEIQTNIQAVDLSWPAFLRWVEPRTSLTSPFLFVWIFNTVDAVMLSWCAILKKDRAYTILNVFWIRVGVVGIFRAAGPAGP